MVISKAFAASAVFGLACMSAANAAWYARFDGVDGSAKSEGPIEILSYAVEANPAAAGQATGKRQHKPFRLRMYYDAASPSAAILAVSGAQSIKSIVIQDALDPARATCTVKIKEASRGSFNPTAAQGGGAAGDWSLIFQTIERAGSCPD
ncbi:MAG: type VI secretion system tube protein Hcp [Parvularculaceae bacterium]